MERLFLKIFKKGNVKKYIKFVIIVNTNIWIGLIKKLLIHVIGHWKSKLGYSRVRYPLGQQLLSNIV